MSDDPHQLALVTGVSSQGVWSQGHLGAKLKLADEGSKGKLVRSGFGGTTLSPRAERQGPPAQVQDHAVPAFHSDPEVSRLPTLKRPVPGIPF